MKYIPIAPLHVNMDWTCVKMGKYYKPIARLPLKQKQWQMKLARLVAEARPDKPIDEPFIISMVFISPRPASMLTKKYPAHRLPKATTPDTDNLIKLTVDALNKDNWFTDDQRAVGMIAYKLYAAKGEDPSVSIMVLTAAMSKEGNINEPISLMAQLPDPTIQPS